MNIPQDDLTQAAVQYGIPPAIIYGISQQPPMPGAGANLVAYGVTEQDVLNDPSLAAQIIARSLRDGYAKYQSWDKAIAAYAGGDPGSLDAPNSPIAGYVTSALAVAASNSGMGMDRMVRMDPRFRQQWQQMTADFGHHIDKFASQGGVTTPQHAQQYRMAAQTVDNGLSRQTDYPIQKFDYQPFDPGFMGSESENFGYMWGGMAEHGNDYGMASGTPLRAAMTGVFHVQRWAGLNPQVEITEGPMKGWKIGYGHMSSLNLKDGQVVNAGDVIGWSGGQPGDPNAGHSSGPHLEFQLIDPSGKYHDPQPLLEATEGRKGSMTSSAMGGGPSVLSTPDDDDIPHKELNSFVGEAKGAGLAPEHFDKYERYARIHNRYDVPHGDMKDFAQTKDMTDPELLTHVHGKSHPTYPEIPVGDFHRVRDHATIYSMQYAQRYPNDSEVARFYKAGAKSPEMQSYFANQNPDVRRQGGPQ